MEQMMPSRVLCESIDISQIPESVLASVRANIGAAWNTNLAGIADLRKHLLECQKYQCAYCQIQILADANGLRELDHILPKGAPSWLDMRKCYSSDLKDRYHTQGYVGFRFEPLNIVLVCKQCNTHKATFDPLTDRSQSISTYPGTGADFQWVHPHFVCYSTHIEITDEWLFKFKTPQGQTLIKVCKLDDAEVSGRRKVAHAYAAQSKNLVDAILKLSANHDRLTTRESVDAICRTFGLDQNVAERLVAVSFEAGETANTELLCLAVEEARAVDISKMENPVAPRAQ